jgi:hypothetical protein
MSERQEKMRVTSVARLGASTLMMRTVNGALEEARDQNE